MRTAFWRGALVMASVVPVAAVVTSVAAPQPGYHGVWQTLYPSSLSDDNLVNGPLGVSCYLCHIDNHEWNGYGWHMRQLLLEGASPAEALRLVEGLNSDGDLTGATNLEEILANAQPGWRPGPTNVTYHQNGTVRHGVWPPEGILGDLDPACTTPAVVTPRPGSGVNPPCLSSATSPVLGSLWRLTVHAGGVPGATATLVQARRRPTSGIFTEVGELLLDPTSPLLFTSLRAGAEVNVHEVLVPARAELLGQSLTVQGAVLVGGKVVQLCNAEDAVLGCGP